MLHMHVTVFLISLKRLATIESTTVDREMFAVKKCSPLAQVAKI